MTPTDSDSDLSALKTALLQKSVRFGDFTLVSGQKSDIYVDARLTTCSAQAIPLIGRVFLRRLQNRRWFPKAVGGLTMGADPIAIAIAAESARTASPIDAFVVRKEPKGHGMQRHIEGLEQTARLPVVIIDDVCSTGGSTKTAIEEALEAGMKVLGAICLVDREMGAPELLSRNFGVELERVFTLSDLRGSSREGSHPHPVQTGRS